MSDKGNCTYCEIPNRVLNTEDYFDKIAIWRNYVNHGIMEYLGGDCPLESIEEKVENEEKYAFYHNFRCSCGTYLRSGISIRSSVPILERVEEKADNSIPAKRNDQIDNLKKENLVKKSEIDLSGKLKLGVLGLLVFFALIYPIYIYVLNSRIKAGGIETYSIIVEKEEIFGGKPLHYSYYFTLKYELKDGIEKQTQIGVSKENYMIFSTGDSIPILYDEIYPKNINLNVK
ncbi:hypothetical protein [Zobellia sp. 1_MG-2023]|uniref:hypothetical protein n=1 Tax=Zobellia sp. 1_MG-2023 TaxID=3062626 RepID=UPI0026E49167|nr:hypothetical protein [Zobellia sp. 1_MG-2023]MDO6820724.1 hypothetical protein [Zobellia sp. 1_MG-2023]